MRKPVILICSHCHCEYKTTDKNRKYCSRSCAVKVNNTKKLPPSNEQREKVSQSLKAFFAAHPERIKKGSQQAEAVGKSTRGKYRWKKPDSILELSSRTVSKILLRLNLPCSRCGWAEAICDLHHVKGRKISNCNNHNNLTYICPNCHRMAHRGKIDPESFIPISIYIGDKWKIYYYG